jgi:hypothetical protein
MGAPHLSQETRAALLALWSAGAAAASIAATVRCSVSTVRRTALRAKVPAPAPETRALYAAEQQLDAVLARYRRGEGCDRIAAQLQLAPGAVRGVIVRAAKAGADVGLVFGVQQQEGSIGDAERDTCL